MKKTILITDDFEASAFVLFSLLKTNGFNVIKTNSAESALKELNGQTIDLIISDYNMPKMNGLEFVERVKQIEKYKKTPIFILSTENKQEIKDKSKKMGVTAWIKKPFKVDFLFNLINRAIEN